MQRAALRLALAAAVLSGAAALVYEVVWLRMLGLVVGHAVDALTAVLAAFMAGLALGAGSLRPPRGPRAPPARDLRLARGRRRGLRRAPAARLRRACLG